MWVPRRIELFIEAIIARLSSIEGSLKDQESAVRDQTKAQNETWKEIPRSISLLHLPANERARADADQERRHRQNHGLQKWLTLGTWLAFIAASIYAGIAALQFGEMQQATEISAHQLTETQNAIDTSQSQFDRTMKQMLAQNEGLRKQITDFETSQRAVLRIQYTIADDLSSVTFKVKNVGHSSATKISVEAGVPLIATANFYPSKGELSPYLSPHALREPGEVLGEGEELHPIVVSGLSREVMRRAAGTGHTRIFYINVGYLDIFGRRGTIAECLYFRPAVGGHIVPCPSKEEIREYEQAR